MRTTFPKSNLTWTALATLALVASFMPVAVAENYGAGTAVEKYDYDYFPRPSSVTSSICFFDDDGNGVHTRDEPILIDVDDATCGTKTEKDDIRLTPAEGHPALSQIKNHERDWDRTVLQLTGTRLIFFDKDTDSKLGGKDTLYLDIWNVGDDTVNIGDLRLMAFGEHAAGTFVDAGDADVSWVITSFGATLTDANVLYKAGSTYYINSDKGTIGTSDAGVEDNDIRLVAKTPHPFGWAADSIQVSELSVGASSAVAGHPVHATFTATNGGKEPAAGLLEVQWNGRLVDARMTPLLAPKESAAMAAFVVAPDINGPVELVIGEATATIQVRPASDNDGRIAALERQVTELRAALGAQAARDIQVQAEQAEEAPGMDAGLLLMVVVLAAGLVLRRRNR